MPSRFALDTAVHGGDGRYWGSVDPGWWIERGPNGGYLGAMLLRAMSTELGADADRTPRSVVVHYLRAPDAGRVDVAVTVERSGPRMTAVSARMYSGQRLLCLALAAFGYDREGPELDQHPPPGYPPPEECPVSPPAPMPIPLRDQYEYRHALGPAPFTGGGGEAVTGGWVRLTDPEPIDAHVLFAAADGWVPSVFGALNERIGVPTVDLTVHVRRLPTVDDGWLQVRFRTRTVTRGFLEEDGEIWDSTGVLLATSRQLGAVLVPS